MPSQAEHDSGSVAASPGFHVQAGALKPNKSYKTKDIVGMPTLEGTIFSGIKSALSITTKLALDTRAGVLAAFIRTSI